MSDYFGPLQTRVLDSTGYSYDQVIYQYKKPPLSCEVNLTGSVVWQKAKDISNFLCPSGWVIVGTLRDQVAETAAYTGDVLSSSSYAANSIKLMSSNLGTTSFSLYAWVNGHKILIQGSNSTDENNIITLNAPPSRGNRVDFVFLEVWRKLITPTDTLYRYGNVLYGGTNFSNDLIDPARNIETSLRVQVQYRIRVVNDIDIETYPSGFDPNRVYAQGPLSSPVACTGGCFFQASFDQGLWIAGEGDSAAQETLETVDGYTYAIPMFALSRRSTYAYEPDQDSNGAGRSLADYTNGYASDRPDNLYSDWVVSDDILDLRHKVAPVENYKEIAQEGFRRLSRGEIKGIMAKSTLGEDHYGTVLTHADAVSNVDKNGSVKIAEGDGVRRVFSNAQVDQSESLKTFTITDKYSGVSGSPWLLGEQVLVVTTNYPSGSYITIDKVYYSTTSGASVFTQYTTASIGNDIAITLTSGAAPIGGSGNITVDYTISFAQGPNGLSYLPITMLESRQEDSTQSVAFDSIRLRPSAPVVATDGTHFNMLYNKGACVTEPYDFGHQMEYHVLGNGTENFTIPRTIWGYDVLGIVSVKVNGTYRQPVSISRSASLYYVSMGSPSISVGLDIQCMLYTGVKFFEANRQGRAIIDTYEMLELTTLESPDGLLTEFHIDSSSKPIIAFGSTYEYNGQAFAYVNNDATSLVTLNTSVPTDATRSRATIKFSTAPTTGPIEVPVLVKSAIESTEGYSFFYSTLPYQGKLDGTAYGSIEAEGPSIVTTAGSGNITNYTQTGTAIFTGTTTVYGLNTNWLNTVSEGYRISADSDGTPYTISQVTSNTLLSVSAATDASSTLSGEAYTITALDKPSFSPSNIIDRFPALIADKDASANSESISTVITDEYPTLESSIKIRIQDIMDQAPGTTVFGVNAADRGRSAVTIADAEFGIGSPGLKFEKLDSSGAYQKTYQSYIFNDDNSGRLYLMVMASETDNTSLSRFMNQDSQDDVVDIFELPGRPLTSRKKS